MHSSIYRRHPHGDEGMPQYFASPCLKHSEKYSGVTPPYPTVARKPLPMESMFSRRLTKLYSDTKTSCNAVTEQDMSGAQPEIDALHLRYRTQKDRLIAWGLQWSEGQQDDIDESIERAGLVEMVGSVLGTIRDILTEVERMPRPSIHVAKPGSGEKGSLAHDGCAWSVSARSRYESLANDLTTSIDTLYDISRSRQALRQQPRVPGPDAKSATIETRPTLASAAVFSSAEYSASDLTLINPATIADFSSIPTNLPVTTLPPKLSPSDLVLPQEEPPPYDSVGVASSIRVIGKLRSRHSSTNSWKPDGYKTIETPVLVEYASYDPTYRHTGVTPSLERLESLLFTLSNLQQQQAFHGTLRCLGYFEDTMQPRYGLVFELPSFVYSGPSDSYKSMEDMRPATLLSVLQTGSKSQHNSYSATPPLEDRFRLALTLALTFNKIHEDNFVHKDVNSSNILVFQKSRQSSANTKALQYALRSPVVGSFDLFSDTNISQSTNMQSLDIYRHPEDPKSTGEKNKEHGPHFDLYSLGMILLEIGMWIPLSDLWKPKYTLSDFKRRVEEVYIRRLASKCGTAYMNAVRDCFWAADRIASGAESKDNISQLYSRIRARLQRCCLLDDVDPLLESGASPAYVPFNGSAHLKRKSANQTHGAEAAGSPHRSAKRWALEKGTEVLERTKSLSKSSPMASPDLSSLPHSESQRSIRKSISHFIGSPREKPSESFDWQHSRHGSTNDSVSMRDVSVQGVGEEPRGDLHKEETNEQSGDVNQHGQPQSTDAMRGGMSFRDYIDKITIIQKAWRQRKAKRSSVQTLLAVATHSAALGCTRPRELAYPTPEPEVEGVPSVEMVSTDDCVTSSIEIRREVDPAPKPKLRLYPDKFPPETVNEWHDTILPRLEKLVQRALKDSDETVSIDLLAIGETAEIARNRPTMVITCSSVPRVKGILKRRFCYDEDRYALKVRHGKIRRSKVNHSSRRRPPHRSMMNTDVYNGDMTVMNPYHQQRPVCGASIGAFRGEHLPPVSFGGVVLVDNEPMGMTVHHLLDAPSDEESDDDDDAADGSGPNEAVLSSATGAPNPWLMGMGAQPGVQFSPSSPSAMWELEISDDEMFKSDDEDAESYNFSDSEFASDEENESSGDDELADSLSSVRTVGDIEGIPMGEGDEIIITQPALDDIEDDFFPNEEDRDEDHIDSHELGYVHASSGIRRWKRDGILHEIDWALLKLNEDRLQPYNLVQGGRRFCRDSSRVSPDQREISTKLAQPVSRRHYGADEDEYPNSVAKADDLGGLNVHCFGRTTGLQGGMVGNTMSSVRIYRRKTFSRSWHVSGGFGVGGDSGAWVIANDTHRVIGHVLAWCQHNHIAYICPMQILLEDMRRTLGAKHIFLPGSVEHAKYLNQNVNQNLSRRISDHHVSPSQIEMERLGAAVEGLGIVDFDGVGSSRGNGMVRSVSGGRVRGSGGACAGMMAKAFGPKRSRSPRLDLLPPLNTSGESDKENLPAAVEAMRNRLMKVQEKRPGGHMDVVGVGVEGVGGPLTA